MIRSGFVFDPDVNLAKETEEQGEYSTSQVQDKAMSATGTKTELKKTMSSKYIF